MERTYRALIVPVFFLCIAGPFLAAVMFGKFAGLPVAIAAMVFWHLVTPRPITILLHFLMWLAVMAVNLGLVTGLLIRFLFGEYS